MKTLNRTPKRIAAQRQASRARLRLLFEQLEDRKLLAVIAGDDFESANFSGGSGWIDGSWQVAGDATVLSSNGPHAGQYHARLRDSSGDLIRAVDVSGHTDVHLQFWSKVNSFEGSDYALVHVSSNGTNWTTVAQFSSFHSDNQYHFSDIVIANPGDTLYVRFDASMNSKTDQWYLDDIAVTGTPRPIASPQISISDAVATEGDIVAHYRGPFAQNPGGQYGALTFGPDGKLYSGIVGGVGGIWRYDGVTGEFVDEFVPGAPNRGVRDIVFRGPHMFVGMEYTDEIQRFNAVTGQFVDVFVSAGSVDGPHGVEFGPDTTGDGIPELFVSGRNSGSVVRYDGETGQPLAALDTSGAGALSFPEGIEFDSNGLLYVASAGTNRVQVFNPISGAYVRSIVSPELVRPKDIKFGPDGLMYVASSGNNRILRFGIDGTFIDDYVPAGSGGISNPGRMTFDSNGDLFVNALQTSHISRFGTESEAVFFVSLSAAGLAPVSIDFSTVDGTAGVGSDYSYSGDRMTFAPGETTKSILVPILDDEDLEDDETFTVKLSNAVGGVIVDAQGVGTIVDNEVPPQVDVSASSENNVYGSVSGSYLATQAADGVVETLTEESYSRNRRSRLEHRWQFDNVTSGDNIELIVVAAQTNSNPVETFEFSYSTDNTNWNVLGNLGPSSYPLPSSLSGTVFIRVTDTDRSNNETTLDVLAVDQLLIRTSNAPATLSSPLAPPLSSFATTAILDQSSTEAQQQRNSSLISAPVLVAQTNKPRLAQLSVASLATTDSLPAGSASSDSDASSVDEVFGDWGLDSSPLLDSDEFGL